MQLKSFFVIVSALIFCGAKAVCSSPCDVDPGDASSENYQVLNRQNFGVNIQRGETFVIRESGSYSFNLNGGTLIVAANGDFEFSENCTYNDVNSIKINSGARVTIRGLQSTTNIVNRGVLTIVPRANMERIVNFNAASSVVNVGTLNILAGLRIDSRFSNKGTVNVDGDLWLNSNDMICLANGSVMHVQGTSKINSAINGDGGCLHSVGIVGCENNYVVNSGNKITPEGDLVYICSENGFAPIFAYNESSTDNKSGGAVLQSNCMGNCHGGSNSGSDDGGDDPNHNDDQVSDHGSISTSIVNSVCSSDPGNVNCDGLPELKTSDVNKNISMGSTYVIKESGRYLFHMVEGATVVVCGDGNYEFAEGCTYNTGTVIINSDANVTIKGLQTGIKLVNRGHLVFSLLSNNERIVNFNSSSSVINAGWMEVVNAGLRLDCPFSNLKEVRVQGPLYLNGNSQLCLAVKSVMHVQGSTQIDHAIYGDGGCLHSEGTVSLSDNFVKNNGKVTPDDELVYICAGTDFSQTFNYDPTKEINRSGGAVLQENCSGCASGNGNIDIPYSGEVQHLDVVIDGEKVVCSGSEVVLTARVNVDNFLASDYIYNWLELSKEGQTITEMQNVAQKKYAVLVTKKDNPLAFGYAEVTVTVVKVAVMKEGVGAKEVVASVPVQWCNGVIGTRTTIPATTTNCMAISQTPACNLEVPTHSNGENPCISLTASNKSVCPNSPVTLSVDILMGSGEYIYDWNIPGEISSSVTVYPQETTDYVVTVKDRIYGFDTTVAITVFVPEIALRREGDKIRIANAKNVYSYVWSTGETTPEIDITGEDKAVYLKVWTPYSSEACYFYAKSTIKEEIEGRIVVIDTLPIIDPELTIQTSGSKVDKVCQGSEVQLNVLSVIGGSGDYEYKWNGVQSSQGASATALADKNKVCFVTVRDRQNKRLHATFKFEIEVMDVKVIQSNDADGNVYFVANGGSSYKWYKSDDLSKVISTDNMVRVEENAYTVYTVDIIDSKLTCRKTISYPNVNAIDISIEGSHSICKGESVRLDVTSNVMDLNDCQIFVDGNKVGSSFELTPTVSKPYSIEIRHNLSRQVRTILYNVSVDENCQNEKIEICGLRDMENGMYEIPADAVNYNGYDPWINNGKFYITEASRMSNMGVGGTGIVYLNPNSDVTLNIWTVEGRLYFMGDVTYTINGNLNILGAIIVGSQAKLKINGDIIANNENAELYNRGRIEANNFYINKAISMVNSGSFILSGNLDNNNHDAKKTKLANYGYLEVNGSFGLFSTNAEVSLEYNSLAKLNLNSSMPEPLYCGGKIIPIDMQTVDPDLPVFICKEKCWEHKDTIKKVVTIDELEPDPFVPVCLMVASGEFSYKVTCTGEEGHKPAGGIHNEICFNVPISNQQDTVHCSIIVTRTDPSMTSDTIPVIVIINPNTDDALKIEIQGSESSSVCQGDKVILRTETTGHSNVGQMDYVWSVRKINSDNSTTDFVVCAKGHKNYSFSADIENNAETCLYEFKVALVDAQNIELASDTKRILVNSAERCANVSPCCRDKYIVDVVSYPTCTNNGKVRLICNDIVCSENQTQNSPSISWVYYGDEFASNVTELANLSAGSYSVKIDESDCGFITIPFDLSNKVEEYGENGWLVTYYGKVDASGSTSGSGSGAGSGSGSGQESALLSESSLYGCIYSTSNILSSKVIADIDDDKQGDDDNVGYKRFTAYIKPVCDGKYTFTRESTVGTFYINANALLAGDKKQVVVTLNANVSYALVYEMPASSTADVKLQWKSEDCGVQESSLPSCLMTPSSIQLLPYYIKNDNTSDEGTVIKDRSNANADDIIKTGGGVGNGASSDCIIPECIPTVPSASNFVEICEKGSEVMLNAKADGVVSYSWAHDKSEKGSACRVRKSGNYKVTLTNWCGATSDFVFRVNTMDDSGIRVAATTAAVCAGDPVKLIADGGVAYQWSSEEKIEDNAKAQVTVYPTKTTDYMVTIFTQGGCAVNRTVNVKVKEPFAMDEVAEVSGCPGDLVDLNIKSQLDYKITPNSNLIQLIGEMPKWMVSDETTTLTVMGEKDGCVNTAKITVKSLYPVSMKIEPSLVDNQDCGFEFVAVTQETLYNFDQYVWTFSKIDNEESDTNSSMSNSQNVASNRIVTNTPNVNHIFPSKGMYRISVVAKVTQEICSDYQVKADMIIEIPETECSCKGCN